MRILIGEKWAANWLDEFRGPGECRIQVDGMCNLLEVDGMYFVRPMSFRLLWNYVREIGPIEVMRKVVSRRREKYRNKKYVSIGYGTILESPDEMRYPRGQSVIFVAPAHPACLERIVIPGELLRPVGASTLPEVEPAVMRHCRQHSAGMQANRLWDSIAGWSIRSGRGLGDTDALLDAAVAAVRSNDWSRAMLLPRDAANPVQEQRHTTRPRVGRKPTATLIGYGNYAKTVVLPNIRDHIQVHRIHEIDPLQIPVDDTTVTWDTAAAPRPDDSYDVLLIAGYHHTHAPLAIEALQRGRYAVVEKPLATEPDQAVELISAVRKAEKLFACFHKRYLPFNEYALKDLGVEVGDPVNYHCIVYEVPLPSLHWYRWPNSKSRVVSNGCHWLDHFLFLNGFSQVEQIDLAVAPDGTVNCAVTLANGAFFTMVLTDRGSMRIGVQDYIELRANGSTVKMVNGTRYEAEGPDRVLRRARINKMLSYREMYRSIGRKIARGEPGDSLASVEVSTSLVLCMESKLEDVLRPMLFGRVPG